MSLPEYWSFLSPVLDENETVNFSDSPYCVSPHTSLGLPYLQVRDFKIL
jgi:hypothetical protein